MADTDKIPVEIDISSKHDPKGVNDAKTGMTGLEKGINSVAQKAELLGKVMRGLGFIAIIQQAISLFISLKDKINAAKEAAEKLSDEQGKERSRTAVESQKIAYDNLKTAIATVNAELSRKAELEAISKGGNRGIEDAKSLVSEQGELSGIAFDDPERKEKEDAVRAKYARQRAITASSRQKEDAVLQRQRLTVEADEKEKAAGEIDAKMASVKFDADTLRSEEKFWREQESLRKRPTFWGVVGIGEKEAETPRSKAAAANAEDRSKRAKELEELAVKQAEDASSLRTDAGYARKKSSETFGVIQSSDINIRAADMEGVRNVRSADYAVVAARQEREAKAREKADEEAERRRKRAELQEKGAAAQAELDRLTSGRDKEAWEAESAREAVGAAKDRYRGSRNTRRRDRELRPLQANLDRQEAEAQSAQASLDRVGPGLVKILNDVFSGIKSLDEKIEKGKSDAAKLNARQKNARVDAGNID